MAVDGNVEVFWITSKELMVKVDGKDYRVTPEEAYALFKDNDQVIEKYNNLMNATDDRNKDGYEEAIDVQFALPFGIDDSPLAIDSLYQEEKRQLVEIEISRLIEFLELKPAKDDLMIQLENCCKLERYIATTFTYQDNIMDKKEGYQPEDIITNELYDGLINKQSVCTTNSIVFREVLSRLGMDVLCVGAISTENGGMHMMNLVNLDGQYYFFDSTLENTIYQEHKKESDIILCCCGLGSQTYSQLYIPQTILPANPNDKMMPVPTNISAHDIPKEIVNLYNVSPTISNKSSTNQI